MENAIANGETAGESKGAHQAPEKDNGLTAGASALAGERGLLVLTVGVSLGMLAYGPIDSLLALGTGIALSKSARQLD